MTRPLSLIGKRFGRLKIVSRVKNNNSGRTMWMCICDCNKKIVVNGGNLMNGHTKSCGCIRKEQGIKTSTTHGFSWHPIYNIWAGIIQRCTNPNRKVFKRYSNLGVSKKWMDFRNFFIDMESKYKKGLCIDRINNNKGYSKNNCRWVSHKENSRNAVHNVRFNGKCASEWAEILGIPSGTFNSYRKKNSLGETVKYYQNKKRENSGKTA